jgi:hypothetical protein
MKDEKVYIEQMLDLGYGCYGCSHSKDRAN